MEKKVASLDLYDYLSNGDAGSDRRLLDGDIVFIPMRYSAISIIGEVMRPAMYELLPNEKISDIIHSDVRVLPDDHLLHILLFGSNMYNNIVNKFIIEATIKFIHQTCRLDIWKRSLTIVP